MVIGDSKSNSLISIKRLTLQQKAKVSGIGQWGAQHPNAGSLGKPDGCPVSPLPPQHRFFLTNVGEVGFRGPGYGDAQLHAVFHERCLHGLRPGIQVQRGREGGRKRQRLRLTRGRNGPRGAAGPSEDSPVVQPPNPRHNSTRVPLLLCGFPVFSCCFFGLVFFF